MQQPVPIRLDYTRFITNTLVLSCVRTTIQSIWMMPWSSPFSTHWVIYCVSLAHTRNYIGTVQIRSNPLMRNYPSHLSLINYICSDKILLQSLVRKYSSVTCHGSSLASNLHTCLVSSVIRLYSTLC